MNASEMNEPVADTGDRPAAHDYKPTCAEPERSGNHCSHSTAWGLRKGEFCANLPATATHKTSRRCVANRKLRAHRSCLLPFLLLSRHYANDCPCTAVERGAGRSGALAIFCLQHIDEKSCAS